MRKKILIGIGVFLIVIVGAFVLFVGPWPTYSSSGFADAGYYKKALAAIDKNVAESVQTGTPGELKAGWGLRKITPPIGTPLAGFGDRQGRPSTGVHDDIYVKAVALSDGQDTVVIVGSDMLIVPENIAEPIRAKVTAQTPLTANDVLLNASHTHGGPGAWGPGYLAKSFGGKYDSAIVTLLVNAFSEAIVEAYNDLTPAELGHGRVDAKDYVRNRTRSDKPTDGELDYMVIKKATGKTCHVVRFSAHPTVLGGSNMEFTGDFPGYVQRTIEDQTQGFAAYLGGAVGSMGPKAPDGADGFAKAQAMGEALARLVLEDSAKQTLSKNVDVVSVGISHGLPSLQLRLGPNWRLSPLFLGLMHVDDEGWLQGMRIGNMVLASAPCDFSGEISAELKTWARQQGIDLWPLSFGGDYVGYVSPDKYYGELRDEDGDIAYETGIMSWAGPDQEAFFTSLIKHMVTALGPIKSEETGAAATS